MLTHTYVSISTNCRQSSWSNLSQIGTLLIYLLNLLLLFFLSEKQKNKKKSLTNQRSYVKCKIWAFDLKTLRKLVGMIHDGTTFSTILSHSLSLSILYLRRLIMVSWWHRYFTPTPTHTPQADVNSSNKIFFLKYYQSVSAPGTHLNIYLAL